MVGNREGRGNVPRARVDWRRNDRKDQITGGHGKRPGKYEAQKRKAGETGRLCTGGRNLKESEAALGIGYR